MKISRKNPYITWENYVNYSKNIGITTTEGNNLFNMLSRGSEQVKFKNFIKYFKPHLDLDLLEKVIKCFQKMLLLSPDVEEQIFN